MGTWSKNSHLSLCLCLVIQAQSPTVGLIEQKTATFALLILAFWMVQSLSGGTSMLKVGLIGAQSLIGWTASFKFSGLHGHGQG